MAGLLPGVNVWRMMMRDVDDARGSRKVAGRGVSLVYCSQITKSSKDIVKSICIL
jgi:hypothetical protein